MTITSGGGSEASFVGLVPLRAEPPISGSAGQHVMGWDDNVIASLDGGASGGCGETMWAVMFFAPPSCMGASASLKGKMELRRNAHIV